MTLLVDGSSVDNDVVRRAVTNPLTFDIAINLIDPS